MRRDVPPGLSDASALALIVGGARAPRTRGLAPFARPASPVDPRGYVFIGFASALAVVDASVEFVLRRAREIASRGEVAADPT